MARTGESWRRGVAAALALGGGWRAQAALVPAPDAVDGVLVVHEGWRQDQPHDPRRLFVLLPPGYAATGTRRYPVLYALDGQDLFDPAVAAGGEEWTLDEILARDPHGVPEMLVVAIESGADAIRAHAPAGSMPDAGGDSTLTFLVDAVRPFVEATYRVRRGRENALVFGHDTSALFAAYAAWRRADVFGAAIALGCPDVDAAASAWTVTPPQGGRPWIWLEQRAAEMPRPSSTDLVAVLQRQADVQLVVAGPQSSRTQRLLTALRGWGRR